MPMKIGYARVSTDEQNLDLQCDALTAFGCTNIIHDYGISGAKSERVGLTQLMSTLKSGDVVVVWKLDRLGRSLAFLIKFIATLKDNDIGFCSITDGIDTTTSTGKLIFHIMGALAEFERDLISERTKAGMKAAKARGSKIGRPRKLNNEQINEAQSLIKKESMTFTELGAIFEVDRTTVSRALDVKPTR